MRHWLASDYLTRVVRSSAILDLVFFHDWRRGIIGNFVPSIAAGVRQWGIAKKIAARFLRDKSGERASGYQVLGRSAAGRMNHIGPRPGFFVARGLISRLLLERLRETGERTLWLRANASSHSRDFWIREFSLARCLASSRLPTNAKCLLVFPFFTKL